MATDSPTGGIGGDHVFRASCFVLTAMALLAGGASGQPFDAAVYTNMPLVILDGAAVPPGFDFRGALAWLVYLPAALGTKIGIDIISGVLAQNVALLAALGAYLLPALSTRVGRPPRRIVVFSCVLVVVVLGRFAPLGLMDLWAASAAVLAIFLVRRPGAPSVLAAGALLGAAVNLRPAYLLSAVFVLGAWAIWVRRDWIWLALGSSMAVLPQAVMELFRPGSFHTWYNGAGSINQLQLSYSAWVVRYDTVPSSQVPQQFFCEPDMASVQQTPIASPTDLLAHLVTHLPQSIDLVLQKLTAWLMWTWSTPFHDSYDPTISQLSVLVVVLVVLGAFGWLQAVRRGDIPLRVAATAAATSLGVVCGAVAATPETRFAMPLVVLGIAGTSLVRFDRMKPRQIAAVTGVVIVVILLGQRGLDHPAPPGGVTPEICAAVPATP